MAQWFMDNYTIITVCLAAVCAVVLVFAIRATSRHNKIYRREEAEIMRLKAIKEKFSALTPDVIKNAQKDELLEGVALYYQLKVQKADNTEREFSDFPVCAKYAYTLDLFVSEGAVASEFYKNNGNILRVLFIPALEAIGESELAGLVFPLSRMYDPDDEMASIDNKVIADIDAAFAEKYDSARFKINAAEYIINNAESFV